MVVRPPELNENLPKSPGMRIVGIIDNFEYTKYLEGYGTADWKNDVRSELDDTPKTIADFESSLKNGTYLPKIYMGPTMSETGKMVNGVPMYALETGWHRVNAHEGLEISTMYFVVVEFFDFKGKPAAYWRGVWKARENAKTTEMVKNERKGRDLPVKIMNMIGEKSIPSTKKDLRKNIIDALIDMSATEAEINKALPIIWTEMGITTEIAVPLTEKERNKIVAAEKELTNARVEKITAEYSSEDYEARNALKMMKNIVKNPSFLAAASKYIWYFNSGDVSKHKDIRKRKFGAIGRMLDLIEEAGLAINAAKKNGEFEYPEEVFYPTLYGEYAKYKETGKLPTK